MATGNDAGQPVGGQQIRAQATNAAAPVAAANAAPPGYDRMRAEHEAAHAVVIDDLGYRVTRVNIAAGQPQMATADWGAFGKATKTINWNNAAERDAIRPQVLGYVTMLVAGHLAENVIDGAIERVSTRIQNNLGLLNNPPSMQNAIADRDRTALFLFLVQRNTLAEVIAAEWRALEVLQRRTAHHKALAELLAQEGTVEGEALNQALGKAPVGDGGQGEPKEG
jgi:hypothetical protein